MKNKSWQKRRLEILNRDKWDCQNPYCEHLSDILEVHHKDYIPGHKIWEYPDDMLISLCSACHGKEQERTDAETMLINAMKMKGFMLGDILSLACKLDTDDTFTNSFLKILRNY
jgi:hypothetical protein